MAVRWSGTQQLYRDTNLPASSSFTICAWVRLVVDTNTWAWMCALRMGGGDLYLVGTAGDGTTLTTWNGSSEISGSALSVGTWYHVAMVVSGTGVGQFVVYLDGALDITNNGVSGGSSSAMIFGDDTTSGPHEPLNGRLAALKIWSAPLTQAEIQQEMRQYQPCRFTNLNAFYPLHAVSEQTVDYSGNARDLTAVGTLTTEDGPPIPWKQGRRRWISVVTAAPPDPDPVFPLSRFAVHHRRRDVFRSRVA